MKAVAALVLTVVRPAPCTCLVHSLSVNMAWTNGWLDRWIELVTFQSFSLTPAQRLFLAGVGGRNDLFLSLLGILRPLRSSIAPDIQQMANTR